MTNGDAPPDDERDEAADEGQQDEADESQADDATSEPEQEKTFTIKVDGEDRVVTESELIAEAQKSASAGKRFEEAAAMRKQYEAQQAQVDSERQSERAQMQQVVNHYATQLQTLMQQGEPDWEGLLNNDPVEYLRLQRVYQSHQQQLQQAQAAQAHLQQQQAVAEQQSQQQSFQRTIAEVKTVIPEWQDPAKFNSGIQELNVFLEQSGIPQNEQSKYFNAPLVKLFRDAQAYKAMLAKQEPALKKVEKLPPRVEKTGQGIRTTDGRTTGMQKLKASGRAEDAAALIANLL